MDGATANRINWRETEGFSPRVNLSELWTQDYIHPEIEAEIAQENLEQAADCLDEGGFFDFDWLECP